jgi:hypothetical protein
MIGDDAPGRQIVLASPDGQSHWEAVGFDGKALMR